VKTDNSDITINGSCTSAVSQNGDITAEELNTATTNNGDIKAKTILGNCSSMNGDVII